jgi:glycosyltransferase involved in cell wall biosynthesis
MPKVSVIIPCYNQGMYIDEAIDSVLNQTLQDFEIIIVNDGSTDEFTNKKLKDYSKPKCKVIHTNNQGLPSARNNGIMMSSGEYILPLDADDKIGSRYLEEASRVLDERKDIGIVYCNADYFGEKSGKWELPEYTEDKMLTMNLIFCTALFRKKDYLETTGYNPNMIYGWEDWDFWLSLLERDKKVHKLQGIHFFYRIKKSDSMVNELKLNAEKLELSLKRIFFNHFDFYVSRIGNPILLYSRLNNILASKDYRTGRFLINALRTFKKRIKKIF